jgi:hypothetical protein
MVVNLEDGEQLALKEFAPWQFLPCYVIPVQSRIEVQFIFICLHIAECI